jgi:hypothetical protein
MDSAHLVSGANAVNAGDPALPTLGARVVCIVCAAMPFPCCEEVWGDFTLRRFDDLGRPSESPEKGLWACERHRPQLSAPKPRVARVVPVEALDDFENLVASEAALLEEAAADQDNVPSAVRAFREEVTRGLASFRKAITT